MEPDLANAGHSEQTVQARVKPAGPSRVTDSASVTVTLLDDSCDLSYVLIVYFLIEIFFVDLYAVLHYY